MARLWPIAGCERAARKRRIRDMDTPRRKRRHSETENSSIMVGITMEYSVRPIPDMQMVQRTINLCSSIVCQIYICGLYN